MTNILVLSDTHTGHLGGLTAPIDQTSKPGQEKAWKFFETGIKKYKPFDVVFCNGDLIDGAGVKSCGVEQITTNRHTQAEMAIRLLKNVECLNGKKFDAYFTRGTPYHTGSGEDFEDLIAQQFVNADGKSHINDQLKVKIEDVTFHLKHKVASGSLTSRAGALNKQIFTAIVAETYQNQEEADVLVRSHVHYYSYVETLGKVAFTTPGLQFWSRYGERECSGIVDFGFITLQVDKGVIKTFTKYINNTPIIKDTCIVWKP